jgi:hypothetical protein
MLELEILEQAEKMNRSLFGVDLKLRGGTTLIADVVATYKAMYPSIGYWVDADSFIFGFVGPSSLGTYKYTLSTDAIALISATLFPLYPTYIIQELVSGIIWMQDYTGKDLYKYNPATNAWTQVLLDTATGYFAYVGGNLYFKDSGGNFYLLQNGAASVVADPGISPVPGTTNIGCVHPARYISDAYATGTYFEDDSYKVFQIKQYPGTTAKKNIIVGMQVNPVEYAMGKDSADWTKRLIYYSTTLYQTYASDWFKLSMIPLYNDWVNVLISFAKVDTARRCVRIELMLYDTTLDVPMNLPQILLPLPVQSTISPDMVAAKAFKPVAAALNGSNLSVYLFSKSHLSPSPVATNSSYPLFEAVVPLR